MKRRRLNRLTRWGGAAVCAALLGLYAANCWWMVRFKLTPRLSLSSMYGTFIVGWTDPIPRSRYTRAVMALPAYFPDQRRPVPPVWMRPLRHWKWSPVYQAYPANMPLRGANVLVPLWMPFVLVAVPTALAWRSELRRRRRDRGCARCGYDLAGLPATAPCPECGRARA